MVLQALADAGKIVQDLDANRAEMRGRADARQLQQMRRVGGAGREQHLRSGTHLSHFAALPPRNPAYPSSLAVQSQYMRAGLEVKVGPPHDWTEEGGGGADAAAVADGALVVGDAFLRCAVVVGIARNSDALAPAMNASQIGCRSSISETCNGPPAPR